MVRSTGHIGIYEGADVQTVVHDVMAIKPNFLSLMGYHILLTMVLHTRANTPKGHVLTNDILSWASHFTKIHADDSAHKDIT